MQATAYAPLERRNVARRPPRMWLAMTESAAGPGGPRPVLGVGAL